MMSGWTVEESLEVTRQRVSSHRPLTHALDLDLTRQLRHHISAFYVLVTLANARHR
jgi:hypothetical protein